MWVSPSRLEKGSKKKETLFSTWNITFFMVWEVEKNVLISNVEK